MTLEYRSVDGKFEIKAVDDKGAFEGYGSVFGVEDSYGDIVDPGAFKESLSRHKKSGTMPALLWQHDAREPVGLWESMKEDSHGLHVRGRLLVDDDPVARRAHAHLKAGSVSGLSIGFMLKKYEIDEDEEVTHLKEIDLWETSIVTFPANDAARVSVVKSLTGGETPAPAAVEAALRETLGLTRRQAKAFMSEGYQSLLLRDVDAEGVQSALDSLINSIKQ